MQKMLVGLFDPPEGNPWAKLGLDDMNSSHSRIELHIALPVSNVGYAVRRIALVE